MRLVVLRAQRHLDCTFVCIQGPGVGLRPTLCGGHRVSLARSDIRRLVLPVYRMGRCSHRIAAFYLLERERPDGFPQRRV